MEETTHLYKDFRFWLATICFAILIWLVWHSYPA